MERPGVTPANQKGVTVKKAAPLPNKNLLTNQKPDTMKNKDIIKVIFRKFKDGEIIALFPGLKWNNAGDICSYMHIGQHGGASPLLVYVGLLRI